jgi:uncharacterized protein YneF (UPF0154 family)
MRDLHDQTDADLTEVLRLARAAMDQEFEVTDRLDRKARGQLTLAGQWFAIVQAVSGIAWAASKAEQWLLICIGAIALLGGVLLGVMFTLSANVWKIRDEPAVSPKALLAMTAMADDPEKDLQQAMVQHYASMLQDRRRNNAERADALHKSERFWRAVMVVPLVELGFVVAARLFQ